MTLVLKPEINKKEIMKNDVNFQETLTIKNGDQCEVIAGTHKGKYGQIADLKSSKTGHITITVVQESGIRLKTLGRNVRIK